ncbi:glycosyltransferase family 2 protein [Stutzerimonas xanthomarina]|uniref:Glycosyltransferase involved in cell wall bisynthesis n=2 Tax=Stutzerimonas xanthomarina TaxID=271420 RepID=A0A1M5P6V9_9GAMM|nr:glycosyltransferase family A protein [Stutzerimonas xanthomarina]MCP9338559.1 glycosyltransferase family 2 protein [Stutzerimonas xanthomarina]SEH77335.1 Glycosyltransferase involved in cell wall bisynthesis [Stutzerimonas xanthomarina]SHG97561.1 Glycosyltransferase involved in cell wall bisynthesis [Stutzerimonas xanthomarina DSM 18231]
MNTATKKTKKTISVIITVYEEYEYLRQAIESVLSQKLLPDQIIVIDDGSRLDTAKHITFEFSGKTKNIEIVYFKKINGGVSSARNYGLQKAYGDCIAFLDVDDKMLPNNLEDKYEILKKLDSEYFGVYGAGITSEGKTQVFSSKDGIIETHLIDVEGTGVPGAVYYYLFNRSNLISVGGFDETLKCNEDYDILIRLFKSQKKCKGATGIGYYRNIRNNSLSRPKDPLPQLNNVMGFLIKAEKMEFFSPEHLGYKRMESHMYPVKTLLLRGDILNSIKYARKAFKFHKPVTIKQKIVYLASFSFI